MFISLLCHMPIPLLCRICVVFVLGMMQLLLVSIVAAADRADDTEVLRGRVIREADGQPISGASIRELSSKRGAYTNAEGRFQLRVSVGRRQLVVRSVGCYSDTVDIITGSIDIQVALRDAPVVFPRVEVRADIEADEIVRRAIEARNTNAAKIHNCIIEMYGRKVQYGRRGFGSRADTVPKVFQYTAQLIQRFKPSYTSRVEVAHRMSSTNVLPEQFGWIPTFEDVRRDSIVIYTEEIVGSNLHIPGPLGQEALSMYAYRLETRKHYAGAYVYVLNFEPRSRVRPGFEGTLHIVEGSYDVVYARLRTTNETYIPFLDSIELEQHYEEVQPDIWLPVQSMMRPFVKARFMAGLLRFASSDVYTTQALSVRINDPVVDSVLGAASAQASAVNAVASGMFGGGSSTIVEIASNADSTASTYWTSLPVPPLTDDEQRLLDKANAIPPRIRRERDDYDVTTARVDEFSVMQWSSGSAFLGINPSLGQTTVTGFFGGVRLAARYDSLRLVAESPFFNAADLLLGTVNISWTLGVDDVTALVVSAGTSSSLRTIQPSVQSLLPTFDTGLLLYGLQRDYYRSDGYRGGLTLRSTDVAVSLDIERAWHIALPRYVAVRQPEVPIDPGRYTLAHVGVSYRPSTTFDLITGYQSSRIQGTLDATIGRRDGRLDLFTRVQAGVDVRIPTMATGYERSMHARIALRGGVTSAGAPQQFHLYSTPRVAAFGDFGDLMTIPLNEYIGTQHAQVVVEHNFSDYLWRSVGLPLILHRGVDIIVSYAAAQFTGSRSTQGWYHEAGVGIDGIPTFIMDHLNLRVDLRWPLSAATPAAGRPGWCIGISTPLMQ